MVKWNLLVDDTGNGLALEHKRVLLCKPNKSTHTAYMVGQLNETETSLK